MKVLDLFSGIGGFSLGLERAGMQTVAFCEIDPFCRQVLAKHWPGVPIYDDITTLAYRSVNGCRSGRPRGFITGGEGQPEQAFCADVICGGFPCQPFSQAGKRGGAADHRALWPEMLRVIREVQPAWVIGENVAGIINMELDTVLSDLEGEGYACQTFVIPACGVDAPHRRDRVWIVGHASGTNGERHAGGVSGAQASSGGPGEQDGRIAYGSEHAGEGRRGRPDCGQGRTIHTDTELLGHRHDGAQPDTRTEARRNAGSGRTLQDERNRNAKSRLGLLDDGVSRWVAELDCGRVATGVPERVKMLRALGNAVVPQVVEVIGRAIMSLGR